MRAAASTEASVDGDGVGIAGSGECGECGEITLSDGGGDDAGCFISEVIGLSSGGGAAVDGDVYIAEIADAIGGDSLDEVRGGTSECVDSAGIDDSCGVVIEGVEDRSR